MLRSVGVLERKGGVVVVVDDEVRDMFDDDLVVLVSVW